jgi:hypothetical protein
MELLVFAVFAAIGYFAWRSKRDAHHGAMFEHYRRNLRAAIRHSIHESGSGRWFLATYKPGNLNITYFDSWAKVALRMSVLDEKGALSASGSIGLEYVTSKDCGEYAIRSIQDLIAKVEGGQ